MRFPFDLIRFSSQTEHTQPRLSLQAIIIHTYGNYAVVMASTHYGVLQLCTKLSTSRFWHKVINRGHAKAAGTGWADSDRFVLNAPSIPWSELESVDDYD